ncbi:uncharacterized protein LOC110863296 [Folsomia candida]|uniref:EGF-like domain-containing protein n=1 Tax=Folsomia candida TaxID=158441 RepID=A0A226F896_FOLCA|nr:uncharacterized protein LOC110863296 [Folsomia candida]OXA65076.1 hypothetical protein Fcan01_02254 [Folsomia candida]
MNEEISLSIIITVSLLLILVQESTCFGFVDYNDECEFVEFGDPSTFVSRLEEWKYCDTNRGLFCVPGLGRCGCLVPLTIYRGGKCRAKVDAGCIVKEYKLECVEHATCARNHSSLTWRCACDRGYLSNAENTACFSRYEFDYRRRNYYRERDGFYYFGNGTRLTMPSLLILLSINFTWISLK